MGPAKTLVTALLALALAGAAKAAPPFTAATAAAIDKAAAAQIAAGKSVGLAVEVIQDGKVVFARGYGKANLEWNTPVTPDTVFRIASNTKAFTAASILVLADQGRLSLDDKVGKYLPDFPRGNEVSIRQLLTHTSGLASYEEHYSSQKELAVTHTTAEMIGLITRIKPLYEFEPGTAYKYSNSGYYVLGDIVETVSGMSLNQFMTQNIFNRIGLQHTAMDAVEDIVPLRAAGYNRVEGRPGVFTSTFFIPYTTPGPAGGLRSTVGDLATWYEALFSGKVVSPALVAQMVTPVKVADGRLSSVANWVSPGKPTPPPKPFEYGFGVRIENIGGHVGYWHSGAIEGFTSQVRTFPADRVTFALLGNTFRGFEGFLETVQGAVLGLPDPAPAASAGKSK